MIRGSTEPLWLRLDEPRKWCLFSVCLLLCVSFHAQRTFAQASGQKVKVSRGRDVEELRMLEAMLRSNYEKISTWSGAYKGTDQMKTSTALLAPEKAPKEGMGGAGSDTDLAPEVATNVVPVKGDFYMNRQVLVRFAVDMRNDRLFTTYEGLAPATYTDLEGTSVGGTPTTSPLRERHIVVSGQHWIQAFPFSSDEGTEESSATGGGRSTAVRRAPEMSDYLKDFSTIIDPRRLFALNGIPYHDKLRGYADLLEENPDSPIDLYKSGSEEGGAYVLRCEYRRGGPKSDEVPIVGEYTFDSSSGYNIVLRKMFLPSGRLGELEEWEYSLVSDVFLPEHYCLTKYMQDSELVQLKRQLALVETKLNEPLDDNLFALTNAGLQDGDVVRDEIEAKEAWYEGGQLVDTPPPESGAPSSQDASPVARRLATIVGVVLLAGILLLYWRRRGKTRRA